MSALLSSDDEVIITATGKSEVNIFGNIIPVYNDDEEQESFDDIDSDEYSRIFNLADLADDFSDDDEVPILYENDDNIVETSGPIIEEITSEDEGEQVDTNVKQTVESPREEGKKKKKNKRKRGSDQNNSVSKKIKKSD